MQTTSKKASSPTKWRDKLYTDKDLPKVVVLNANGQRHWHGRTMVVPAPLEVDGLMAAVPKGKVTTIEVMRQQLAKKHHADIGCQLTTGIFAWIAANAAMEAEVAGVKKVTPWWRTLKSDGSLNPKYPGGGPLQKERLEQEGHTVINKDKKLLVTDYQEHL